MKLRILAAALAMVFAGSAFGAELETTVQGQSLTEKEQKRASRRTLRGYKATIDAGFTFCQDKEYYDGSDDFWEALGWAIGRQVYPEERMVYVSTTHGYQFNNYFFLGGGVELGYYIRPKFYSVPVFVDAKVNFINKKITPFLDTRVGYAFGDNYGTWWSEALGVRFALNNKSAITLCIEQRALFSRQREWDPIFNNFGLRVGYEF